MPRGKQYSRLSPAVARTSLREVNRIGFSIGEPTAKPIWAKQQTPLSCLLGHPFNIVSCNVMAIKIHLVKHNVGKAEEALEVDMF